MTQEKESPDYFDLSLLALNGCYRRMFELSGDGIMLINAVTGEIEDANVCIIDMLGYSLAELRRKTLWDLGMFADVAESKEQFAKLRDRGYVRYDNLPLETKQGGNIEVEFVSTTYSCQGMFIMQCNVRNITERRETEETLRAKEEQLRGLVEQALAGICMWQDGKTIYANPRWANILGHQSARELIGVEFTRAVARDDRGRVREAMRRVGEGEERSVALEFRALRIDGSTVDIGANISLALHARRPALIGLLQDVSDKKRAQESAAKHLTQLKSALMATVTLATTISEMRDPYTAGHERRVADLSATIGAELGFSGERQEGLRIAGSLHDIGKLAVPLDILCKPGKLSAEERKIVQKHTRAGHDVLKSAALPWLVAEVALLHHERMDGTGYPFGRRGEAIPIEARIIGVADVIEAMSAHRPYRPGLGIKAALDEIEKGRGLVYDAAVVDACLRIFREKHYQLPAVAA